MTIEKLELLATEMCKKLVLIDRHIAEHRGQSHSTSLELFEEEIRQIIIDGLNDAHDLGRQPIPLGEMTATDMYSMEANIHQIMNWARRNARVLSPSQKSRRTSEVSEAPADVRRDTAAERARKATTAPRARNPV
jgi:hypothetical protein